MCLENGNIASCQVVIVDRFKRTVTVDVAGMRRELHASCLDIPEGTVLAKNYMLYIIAGYLHQNFYSCLLFQKRKRNI